MRFSKKKGIFEFGAETKQLHESGNSVFYPMYLPGQRKRLLLSKNKKRTILYFLKFYKLVVPLQPEASFQGFSSVNLNRIHPQALH